MEICNGNDDDFNNEAMIIIIIFIVFINDNIYTYELGILWIHNYEEQFIAHGVHMIFDGCKGILWNDTMYASRRYSRLVIIGLNLDQVKLEGLFTSCINK